MKRYILLPRSGFELPALDPPRRSRSVSGFGAKARARSTLGDADVLAQAGETGPLIVQMDPENATALRRTSPDFRVAPERRYRKCMLPIPTVRRESEPPMRRSRSFGATSQSRETTRISVVDDTSGQPLQGVEVVVYSDRHQSEGVKRRTGKTGQAKITLLSLSHVEEVLIFPQHSYWGLRKADISLHDVQEFRLRPIGTFTDTSLLRRYFAEARTGDGAGVKVGVIDSGIDSDHPELADRVVHHEASVLDEDEDAARLVYSSGHGTHVAGIIAARSFGLAPSVSLYDYRVFSPGRETSGTGDILRAIYRATDAGCDLLNLSFAGGLNDEALNVAIGYAREKGVVCFVAAGNRSRQSVDYPGSFKRSYAVTAYGHRGSMPVDAVQHFDLKASFSASDRELFMGGFSNVGPEVDFAGPGVGVVSTWPDGRLRIESGTSMATPALVGLAARLLSRDENRHILKMDRTVARARAIVEMVERTVTDIGFSVHQQGAGAPQDKE